MSTIFLAKYLKLGIIKQLNDPLSFKNLKVDPEIMKQLTKAERDFLNVLRNYVPGSRKQRAFERALKDFYVDFIDNIAVNLKKYNRKETIAYYRDRVLTLWG